MMFWTFWTQKAIGNTVSSQLPIPSSQPEQPWAGYSFQAAEPELSLFWVVCGSHFHIISYHVISYHIMSYHINIYIYHIIQYIIYNLYRSWKTSEWRWFFTTNFQLQPWKMVSSAASKGFLWSARAWPGQDRHVRPMISNGHKPGGPVPHILVKINTHTHRISYMWYTGY